MGYKLYFFLVGCKPQGRHTEQHDVFFGIGKTPRDLINPLKEFWPEAEGLHIDCWREVSNVNGFKVEVIAKNNQTIPKNNLSLYFINLGGYRKGEFEEFHFKDIYVATSQAKATAISKKTAFYRQFGFKGAVAHTDDHYGIDIDDIYPIEEILSPADKSNYSIVVTNELAEQADEIHLGYITLSKLSGV